MEHRDSAHPARTARVIEAALRIPKQCVFLGSQSVDEYVGPSIVIVITEICAHTRERVSVVVIAEPGSNGYFLKCAIPLIPEQLLRKRVIGDQDVRPAVAIEVVECDSETLAGPLRDP